MEMQKNKQSNGLKRVSEFQPVGKEFASALERGVKILGTTGGNSTNNSNNAVKTEKNSNLDSNRLACPLQLN